MAEGWYGKAVEAAKKITIQTLEKVPSPSSCGCEDRKQWLIDKLRGDD